MKRILPPFEIKPAIPLDNSIKAVESGAVRVSLNYLNTEEEIDQLIEVIKGIS